MKKFYVVFGLVFSLFLIKNVNAQDITVSPVETLLSDTLGSSMTFHINITNNTSSELTLCIVRTINDLPVNWTSSICLDVCYSHTIDSVLTNSEFLSTPLVAAETRELKIIVQSDVSVAGVGNIQLKISDFRNQSNFQLVNLEASTMVTAINDLNAGIKTYSLNQNYPNPFNPSTKISFNLAEAGDVIITVFDLLGRVVAEPVNEYRSAGLHSFNFDASELSSGTYFYRIESPKFSETKKMILEK